MPITTADIERFFVFKDAAVLEERFFSFRRDGDAVPSQDSAAKISGHSLETGWYDGPSYFARLIAQMDELIENPLGAVWWMHGWYFQLFAVESNFTFWGKSDLPESYQLMEPTDGWKVYYKAESLTVNGVLFADKLRQMDEAGVDVRIIGWLPPIMFKSKAIVQATNGLHEVTVGNQLVQEPAHIFNRNIGTLHALLKLRNGYLPEHKVVFNTLTHPLGGAHTKFVIAGNLQFRRAFIGGIDAGPSRNKPSWSDAAFAVEGTAATHAAKFFVQLWNEIQQNPGATIKVKATTVGGQVDLEEAPYLIHYGNPITASVDHIDPVLGQNTAASAHVQLFRTVPAKKYADPGFTSVKKGKRYFAGLGLGKKMGLTYQQAAAVGVATVNLPHVWTKPLSFAKKGLFEYKRMVFKAVMAAEKYIYIMDQAPSQFEVATAINNRLRELRLEGKFLKVIVLTPIHDDGDLEGGGEELTREEREQRAEHARQQKYLKQFTLFSKMADGIPETDYAKHFIWIDAFTHAKVVLIDDKFVSIGSANFMLRSSYTDIEMGAAIMHEAWVQAFRKGMWGWFCASDANTVPTDIVDALSMWSLIWEDERNTIRNTTIVLPRLDNRKVKGKWMPHQKPGKSQEDTYLQNKKFKTIASLKAMVEDPDSNVPI